MKIEIIPAIDLKGGKCVRLYQGNYDEETVFSENPVEIALEWQSMGASRLHVVDLDGAASGEPGNMAIIRELGASVLIPAQIGGGIRRMETVEELLRVGFERVILGTAAVEDPELVSEVCRRFGDAIIAGIDARDGRVATHGWQRETGRASIEFTRALARLGVKRFIYTDISRDGTLTEPNFSAITELIDAVRLPVIAAGGISSLTHLRILKQLGAEGAIIGRALYTGDIKLKEAIQAVS